jgi:hypothetical protein
MSTEMVKTVMTYLIALVVIVGTGVLLRFPPPGIPPETLLTFLATEVGFVMAYVFQDRATAAGAASMPTITTNSPPVTTVVRSPAEQESYDAGDYK